MTAALSSVRGHESRLRLIGRRISVIPIQRRKNDPKAVKELARNRAIAACGWPDNNNNHPLRSSQHQRKRALTALLSLAAQLPQLIRCSVEIKNKIVTFTTGIASGRH